MNNNLDFQKDLAIDLDNLHSEWQFHSSIRYKYACKISELDQKVKKAHEKIKVERSKLIRNAHENSEKIFDKKKPTAPEVEAYYRTHEDHKKAKDELIKAEYDLSMAYNAVYAFNDRKNALENEVKLFLANYFSTPREEREIESGKLIIDVNREKTEQTQRKAVNRRRRK